MKYFASCTTLDALKHEYRRLCKLYHPDLGGDTATMAAINDEYDEAFRRLQSGRTTAQQTADQRDRGSPRSIPGRDFPAGHPGRYQH